MKRTEITCIVIAKKLFAHIPWMAISILGLNTDGELGDRRDQAVTHGASCLRRGGLNIQHTNKITHMTKNDKYKICEIKVKQYI